MHTPSMLSHGAAAVLPFESALAWSASHALLTMPAQMAHLPLSTGVGSFLLARAACEMLCEALSAAWLAGRAAPVRRLMLLPQGGNADRMVSVAPATWSLRVYLSTMLCSFYTIPALCEGLCTLPAGFGTGGARAVRSLTC